MDSRRGDRRGRVPGGSRKGDSRRGRGRGERDEDIVKPPVILAKPQPVVDNNEEEWPTISAASGRVMVIKSRTHSPAVEVEKSLASAPSHEGIGRERKVIEKKDSVGSLSGRQPGTVQIQSSAQRERVQGASESQIFTNTRYAAKNERASPETSRRRVVPEESADKTLKGGIHIISEHMDWIDNAQEFLSDQTDFLVIGVVGPQGTGKSTLLSMLGGNDPLDMFRQYIFRPASREATETSKHQTAGVQFYVTQSRVILLDAQPLCSPAILDEIVRLDRRYNYEYKTVENFLEVESLQIAAFMLQVCHVLLVTTDWFVDLNLLRFIREAEMLKPSISLSDPAGYVEHFPHLRGISLAETSVTAYNCGSLEGAKDVNYFVLPDMKLRGQKAESSSKFKIVPDYELLVKELRLKIRSLPRPVFSQTPMTEKAWFQFAARAWDNVRKSHMIAAFGRALP